MKITVEVELQSFEVPTCVWVKAKPKLKQDGISKVQQIPLSELDSVTLDDLCREFRRGVFRVAEKNLPDNL